jgi:hypothetical protein
MNPAGITTDINPAGITTDINTAGITTDINCLLLGQIRQRLTIVIKKNVAALPMYITPSKGCMVVPLSRACVMTSLALSNTTLPSINSKPTWYGIKGIQYIRTEIAIDGSDFLFSGS